MDEESTFTHGHCNFFLPETNYSFFFKITFKIELLCVTCLPLASQICDNNEITPFLQIIIE